MAFPPPTQATNVNNATPQQDTHPDLHNAANQAINDIRDRVLAVTTAGRANATSQGTPSAAYDPLFFGTVVTEPGGWFNGTDITPPDVGYYLVTAYIRWLNTPAGTVCAAEFRRGSAGSMVCRADAPAGANPDIVMSFVTLIGGGNNPLQVLAYQNSGSSKNVECDLAIVRVA